MARKSYSELLKDPRWQRRRLEILQRADFKCESCDSADKTLHVHHKLYRKGAMPWEYENYELQALCEDCHASDHERRERLNEALAVLGPAELDVLLGFAEGWAAKCECTEKVVIRNAEHAMGISACFWPTTEMPVVELLNARSAEGATVDLEALWELSKRRRLLLGDS